MAVHYFMTRTARCGSAAQFLKRNPRLLDKRIMLSHYSETVLFSDRARAQFVAPDLDPIPDSTEVEQVRVQTRGRENGTDIV